MMCYQLFLSLLSDFSKDDIDQVRNSKKHVYLKGGGTTGHT
jgi:hypothetical protein